MDLVTAGRLCLSSLFPSDNQRPSNLVIAVLAPAAHRSDRRAIRKSGHYDAEIAGALGAASGEIFCHLGRVNGFHTQAKSKTHTTAKEWKYVVSERQCENNSPGCGVKLSINGNIGVRSRSLRKRRTFFYDVRFVWVPRRAAPEESGCRGTSARGKRENSRVYW